MRKPVFCILVSLFILFLVYKKVQKITSSEDRYLREKHKKSWIITRTKTLKKYTRFRVQKKKVDTSFFQFTSTRLHFFDFLTKKRFSL